MKRFLITFASGILIGVLASVYLCLKNEKIEGPPVPPGAPPDSVLVVEGTPEVILKQTAESGPEQRIDAPRRSVGRRQKPSPSIPDPTDRTPANAFQVACLDWQDAEGRFYFHQDTRRLSIEQHFRVDFRLVQHSEGRVEIDAYLLELSPRTGDVLHRLELDRKAFDVWAAPPPAPPKYVISVGGALSTDGFDPYLYAQRNFGRFLFVGVLATPETAVATAGATFSF